MVNFPSRSVAGQSNLGSIVNTLLSTRVIKLSNSGENCENIFTIDKNQERILFWTKIYLLCYAIFRNHSIAMLLKCWKDWYFYSECLDNCSKNYHWITLVYLHIIWRDVAHSMLWDMWFVSMIWVLAHAMSMTDVSFVLLIIITLIGANLQKHLP